MTFTVPALASSTMDGLTRALYASVFEEPPWDSFLSMLVHAVAADHVNLTLRRADAPMNEATQYMAGVLNATRLETSYWKSLYVQDPIDYHNLEAGRIYSFDDAVGSHEAGAHPFMRDYLAPAGLHWIRIAKVVEPEGYRAWITIARNGQRLDFEPAAVERLQSILPHLSLALRSFAANQRARYDLSIYEDTLQRLSFGCLSVDRSGYIIQTDQAARRLIERSDSLRRSLEGRLSLRSPEETRRLHAAIKAVAESPPGPKPGVQGV